MTPAGFPPWLEEIVHLPRPFPGPPLPAAPDFDVDLVRADDLLSLHVSGYNLHVHQDDAGARLSRIDATQDAFLVVTFPPQNIAEGACYQQAGQPGHPLTEMHLPPDAPGETTSPPDGQPNGVLLPPGDIPARLAGPSRLVFRVPAGAAMPDLPYTIEGLLDWSGLEPVVPPIADIGPSPTQEQIDNAPDIAEPGLKQTALELPYRLILAPQSTAGWLHATSPVVHESGRTELWHTRLSLGTATGTSELWDSLEPAYLRAVWSPDYLPDNPPCKGENDPDLRVTDISPNDRYQLVVLTSGFHGWAAGPIPPHPGPFETPFLPLPVQARLLMLSAMGGWLRARGAWDPPHGHRFIWPVSSLLSDIAAPREVTALDPAVEVPAVQIPTLWEDGPQLDLSEWVHVAAQGRDHYVRIVYEGFLYPFGNRAALIKITERKFIDVTTEEGNQTPAAYLIQRQYIVVREPEKVYPDGRYTHDGREMPIKKILVTTAVTPDLHLPRDLIAGTAFSSWIVVDQDNPHDFQFHVVATDVGGNASEFTASMIFFSAADIDSSGGPLNAVAKEYQRSGSRRSCAVGGQKVTYAARDETTPETDNTTTPTDELFFDTEINPEVTDDFGGYLPFLFKANVRLASAEQLLGTSKPATIRLYPGYLQNDLDPNAGVFAELVQDADSSGTTLAPAALPVTFTPKQGGGLATPNMNISSLTRRQGPTAGTLANAAQDAFDANDFFGGLSGDLIPKLFGSLKLTDILPTGGADSAATNAPKVDARTTDVAGGGKLVTVTFDWAPQLRPFSQEPLIAFTPSLAGHGSAALTIHAEVTKHITPQGTPTDEGTSSLRGTLTNFTITLLDSVAINVVSFAFSSDSGAKPHVAVQLDDTEPFDFTGDLTFVQQLQNIIPAGALGDGPSLDLTPAGVHVGFAIGLPPAAIGIFSLENVKFTAGLDLPFFSGSPVLDLAFAEREHPFTLTVAIFGGGGFFHLQLDTGGLRMLEAAFEFGAAVSMDIGVASGGVHIMAGIYFCIQETPTKKTTLTGFFRVGGEVSVLGIASVSVEFELDFTYQDKGKATGQATVSISVHVLFFSDSFSVTVQKTFGGSGGDPSFADLITTPQVWAEYASAFA